jgi:pimeloyl-ACP methyl ester carboxylesterase
MRRLLLFVLVLAIAAIAVPPAYFKIFPERPPQLPAPGVRIPVQGGLAVNAIVRGDGPAVVLVHGLPGSGYDWAPLTDALAARGFHVIAYDRIGYGRSDTRSNDDDFTIASNAQDLLGLLVNQDLHDVTIVGWSYGGPIAIEAAGRDASRIGRLVLVASGGPAEAQPKRSSLMNLLFAESVLDWLHAVPPVGRGVQAAMSRNAFSGGPEPDWWLPQLAANFAAPNTVHAFAQEEDSIADGDASIDPLTVGVPILLIHGNDDRLAPLSIGQWIKSHARNARLVVVEGGSHMLPLTHTEMLADRIAGFARPD